MAKKKKNDFWDDADVRETQAAGKGRKKAKPPVQEEWSATKSTPIKFIMRLLLMISCLAALGSAFIAYTYVGDRYAGGSFSNDYFNSGSFAEEYDKSVDQLMELVKAIGEKPEVIDAGHEDELNTMVVNLMGQETNFAFMIQDGEHFPIASSGDDAKDRIESSNHYALIANADNTFEVKSTIPGSLLNKAEWEEALAQTGNQYYIYTAVDNNLTYKDSFYQSSQTFDKMSQYFGYARIVGIVAAVLFIICLVFCIMATGMKRGYEDVQLTWFDRFFTEIALVIMVGIAAALIFGQRKLLTMDGPYFKYAAVALVPVIYGWIIRSYFSIVRRIKAGQLLRHSIIGTIIGGVAHVIGKLPSPLNLIVGAIILIAINGGLVYGVINLRQYTFRGIPIMYIVAPIVFVIELLALIVHNSGADDEDEEEAAELPAPKTDAVKAEAESAAEPAIADQLKAEEAGPDWEEEMDLGRAIADAEKRQDELRQADTSALEEQSAAEALIEEKLEAGHMEREKTLALTPEEMEKAFMASGVTPEEELSGAAEPALQPAAPAAEAAASVAAAAAAAVPAADDEGMVNFVQLNKDIRKHFRTAMKQRGITTSIKAPEKPVIIDIDRNSLEKIVENVFQQIERLSADGVRNYIEIYRQADKVVYIVRINTSEETREAAAAAGSDGSFDAASKIVTANDGRFITSMDGDVLKVGVLIEAAG